MSRQYSLYLLIVSGQTVVYLGVLIKKIPCHVMLLIQMVHFEVELTLPRRSSFVSFLMVFHENSSTPYFLAIFFGAGVYQMGDV
jgi:hypothetical protein